MRLQGTIYRLPNFWTTCSSIAAHPGQNVPFCNTGSDYTNKAFCAESTYLVLMKVIIENERTLNHGLGICFTCQRVNGNECER